jgi:hypothetical protein
MRKLCLSVLITVILTLSLSAAERPFSEHKVYFEGTDYELSVYKIYGRKNGKTMLIVGGLQGDEPGGFLSADLYSELRLEEGNLIVIPRANFKSIILFNRGTDGDMNRRFHIDEVQYEMDKVVQVIKELMGESDIFINLHDGWGFHSPEHTSWLRSPERFGQSIIVDSNTYTCSNGEVLDLEKMAKYVLNEVNQKIKNENYHMHYFNTQTQNPDTPFEEMKKTATFYALREHCIPAFGVETSKNLPSQEMKILHHNYAVNAFMQLVGIVPEQPKIFLPKPEIKYVILNINGEPKVVMNDSAVKVGKGSIVEVSHIEANYSRGLSCDIENINGLNDKNIPVEIRKNTSVIFRKDSEKIGKINIVVEGSVEEENRVFIVKVNGSKKAVINGGILEVRKGDTLELVKFFSELIAHEPEINFKGWVPEGVTYNDGDDRGYDIMINSSFMNKYSKYGKGKFFPVVAGGSSDNILGTFYVKISD